MPLLESDASFVDKELQPQVSEASEAQQFNLDSAMASPPRESRELNEYLLKWSNETKLLAPVDTSKCKSVSEPSTPKGAEESNMAVSYIQSNDLQHNNIELENVMGQHDYARKRRRSFSSPSDYELNADDLTPLLIRELSVSPSRFRQQHTVGLPTKDERTGGLERGDTKVTHFSCQFVCLLYFCFFLLWVPYRLSQKKARFLTKLKTVTFCFIVKIFIDSECLLPNFCLTLQKSDYCWSVIKQ